MEFRISVELSLFIRREEDPPAKKLLTCPRVPTGLSFFPRTFVSTPPIYRSYSIEGEQIR